MDKHWNIEITGLEGMCNVVQVHLNFVLARLVVGRVGGYLDCATVFSQQEVVRDFVLGKAHSMVATFFHLPVLGMVLLSMVFLS